MSATFFRPVVALVLWTFVMWTWMYVTRIPAIRRARMKLDPTAPRGEQMATLPPEVRWKADNYNHLFEQPTLFYAVAITLGVLGDQSSATRQGLRPRHPADPSARSAFGSASLDLGLAWGYVALRVVHSIFQSTAIRAALTVF